jgi:tetratricopeptide (TPR) repeat protein
VRILTCLLFVALIGAVPAFAAGDPWQAGLIAFQQNDYENALVSFETARDAGQGGPAVHYNIGVCQYKIGRYSDAGQTFSLVRDQFPAFVGLAEYNLGLVAQKLHRDQDALAHFRRSYELSGNDETVRALSAEMLARLTPDPVLTSNTWTGAIGIRAGYDDNVALRDELGLPAGTSADSPMTDIFASADLPISRDGALHFNSGLYAVRYFDADTFDQDSIQAGIVYRYNAGEWRARFGAYGNYGTIGGHGFDQTGSLRIRFDRRMTEATSLSLRVEHQEIDARNDMFSGIEGSRQRIEVRHRWYSNERSFLTRIQFETNDRADPGVSPDRVRLSLDYRYSPQRGWGYEAGAGLRSSDYDGVDPARTEDLMSLRLGISRMINDDWQLLANYQFSDNDSSDSAFTYDRNRLMLSVMRIF